ncbi:MAG: T9SS type A sorting domain-containing protein, partial [Bacteroidetes bacterium]|nr:T9SS type A sorting domain-containing protein [Bacteroidota bacterium]
STQCNSNSWAGANNTVSGTTLVANNADSDFALLKLSSAPPSNYEVYYSGWDRTGNPSAFQTGIHHPSGDLKKISRDNNPATQAMYSSAFCWRIGNWEEGTTEGGSSGSPLFNDAGLIIGQLYGGSASCSNISEDFYGRFDVSWDYSNDIAKQLKNWLDPCGTNETTIEGYDPNTITADEDAALQYAGYISSDFCGSKVSQDLLLKNRGNFNLTTATISYGFDGNMQQYNWTGNLLAGENETILLDSVALSNGNHSFRAFIVSTNLANDTNYINDTTTLNATINNGVNVEVALTTNYYGSENTFQIIDYVNNTLIDDQGPFGIMDSYNNSFCLPEGGYCITLTDDGGDGLAPAFFVDQGNYMLNVNGEELYNTDAIGGGVSTCFKYYGGVFYSDTSAVVDTTGILDVNIFNNFILYPNPSNGVINIKSTERINEMDIYNVAGAKVYAQQFNEKQISILTTHLSKGMYLVKVHTDKGVGVKKLVIE